MLVLTRKRGQSITIGHDVVIKVIHTSRGMVKLGIEAPPHVRVLRAELEEFATGAVAAANDDPHQIEGDSVQPADQVSDDEYVSEFHRDYFQQVEDVMQCICPR